MVRRTVLHPDGSLRLPSILTGTLLLSVSTACLILLSGSDVPVPLWGLIFVSLGWSLGFKQSAPPEPPRLPPPYIEDPR